MTWLFITVIFTLSYGVLARCPLYWTPHEDSCYVIPQTKLTWTAAMAMCMAHGAYLAEITSQEENNFVLQFVRQSHPNVEVWVGGSDVMSEGHWLWSHSETLFDYQNWNAGEPDNDDDNQHCLAIRLNGRWDDNYCDKLAHGVCEKRQYTNPAVGR